MATLLQQKYWDSMKGKPSIHKGRKRSVETRAKMRISMKGRTSSNKGKKASLETRKKLSESHRGYVMPEEQKNKIRLKSTGRKHTEEVIKKMSESRKGERNPMWKGGLTAKSLLIRMSLEYRLWRKAVYERDDYTCQECGDNKGNNLEAHHIKPFYLFPDLRTAIDNGVTLCKKCHKETNSYGRPHTLDVKMDSLAISVNTLSNTFSNDITKISTILEERLSKKS